MNPSMLIRSNESNPEKAGYFCSIRNYSLPVWEQRRASCTAYVYSDITTIVHRLRTGNTLLSLSPRPLFNKVSESGLSDNTAEAIVCKVERGLEERDHPDEVVDENAIEDDYKSSNSKRYSIRSFTCVPADHSVGRNTNIIFALIENFGPNGNHFPVKGYCLPFGALTSERAAETTMTNPFRWSTYHHYLDFFKSYGGKLKQKQIEHVVLITGVYVIRDTPRRDEHLSVEFKNSYGKGWGNDGFAWVTPDFFQFIDVPVM